MTDALFAAACLGVLAVAWPARQERMFALLLAASWAATFAMVALPHGAWSYAGVMVDGALVLAGAVALAVAPRLWLGVLVAAALLQLCDHLVLQASDGAPLDRWRYLVALNALFALQLAATAAPGVLRRLRRTTTPEEPLSAPALDLS